MSCRKGEGDKVWLHARLGARHGRTMRLHSSLLDRPLSKEPGRQLHHPWNWARKLKANAVGFWGLDSPFGGVRGGGG
jgi:hypothetical protein